MFECYGFLLVRHSTDEFTELGEHDRIQHAYFEAVGRNQELSESMSLAWNNGQASISLGRVKNRPGQFLKDVQALIETLRNAGFVVDGLVAHRDEEADEAAFVLRQIGDFPVRVIG